jgi:peptide/nickel transport system ATP-binding protein
MQKQNDDIVLEFKDLKTWFYTDEGIVRGCDGVNLTVKKGEILAIVGESGSGKSVTSLSAMQLIPTPPGRYVGGEVLFQGTDLLKKTPREMRKIRGNKITMIFQEPMTSLNPVYKIGKQITEPLKIHQKMKAKEAKAKAISLLKEVGIPSPEQRFNEYPAQMSGGMRQRVMIAIALACNPTLLIADEPTSALDVTIQEQLMQLIKKLQKEQQMAVMFITHDLGVVAEIADSVAVMYAGKVVEYGSVKDLFKDPKHPYLDGLKKCIPRLDIDQEELTAIEGMVPNPLNLPEGCRFAPRCSKAMDICRKIEPGRTEVSQGHSVCCWLYASIGDHHGGK